MHEGRMATGTGESGEEPATVLDNNSTGIATTAPITESSTSSSSSAATVPTILTESTATSAGNLPLTGSQQQSLHQVHPQHQQTQQQQLRPRVSLISDVAASDVADGAAPGLDVPEHVAVPLEPARAPQAAAGQQPRSNLSSSSSSNSRTTARHLTPQLQSQQQQQLSAHNPAQSQGGISGSRPPSSTLPLPRGAMPDVRDDKCPVLQYGLSCWHATLLPFEEPLQRHSQHQQQHQQRHHHHHHQQHHHNHHRQQYQRPYPATAQ
ncbi:ell-associated factor Eaf-like [Harpegnathos saltator]|uniref:ell-associated factor Eaf-like n=1 Tax=Harpegnathos saltator TaxID=610380 RepID=UPI000DBEEBD5|nr:ell-associated factor Eaf-like [Harpegnathos saltator]